MLLYDGRRLRLWRWLGNIFMASMIIVGYLLVMARGRGLYLGLILVWAVPFALLLWYVSNSWSIQSYFLINFRNLAYQFIIQLPLSGSLFPIALPTLYLWVVDTIALRRGTWVIESGTKIGWHILDGLEIEYDDSTVIHNYELTIVQGSRLLSSNKYTDRLRPYCL